MKIISRILEKAEFINDPPILLDIGASSKLHDKWKRIARYSVCIAFDADKRDIDFVEQETKRYKRLYVFNRIVTDIETNELDFHLTHSPYCSSTLKPDHTKIKDWEFAQLFEVERTIRLKTVVLRDVIAKLGVKKIDWFKTDSQGTDLRLFKSLGERIQLNTLIAEFEPGIIDVYEGEDKLHHLMSYMDQMPFWMSDIHIQGCRRIGQNIMQRLAVKEKRALQAVRVSPGWAEVVYINTFGNEDFSKRDYLLGCVFAIIEKQYGFALELSIKGYEKFRDSDFKKIESCLICEIGSDADTRMSNQTQRTTPKANQNKGNFLKILRRVLEFGRTSKSASVTSLPKDCMRGVDLTIEQGQSLENSPFLLHAKCRGYASAYYKFWGKKGNDFEILRDWDSESIFILSEEHKAYDDYGVHVRSESKGEWQDQAWSVNKVWKTNKS